MSAATPVPPAPPVGADVLVAAAAVTGALAGATADLAAWDHPAGTLEWSCRRTAAHVVDAVNWYAALLARRAGGDVEIAEMSRGADPAVMLDALSSAAATLATVVDAAPAAARGWHSFGIADASGFAAMGCDELLVHAYDLAGGLGAAFEAAPALSERVLRRLFPWAPAGAEPWPALLWANGRRPLGDLPADPGWLWHCAPVEDWDGRVPRRRGQPSVTE